MNAAVRTDPAGMHPSIAAVLTHTGPVLLDFDETLYLRNSTEDFIDCARPALLALLVLRLLDFIRPWRWTGGEDTRDVWRVRCIVLCFPWTHWLWRRRIGSLASQAANLPLIQAVKTRAQATHCPAPVIATLGFSSIVVPLAAALGLPTQLRIVAPRLDTFADRRAGKFRLVAKAIGHEAIRRALVLTDSPQDQALLNACAQPLHTVWPEARFRPALAGFYLPGQYLSRVKRPGERYITRGILQEDFALWVLSSVALSTQPFAHIAAMLLLLLSFWTIYERGYVDNDLIAARYEHDPKLHDAFYEALVPTPFWTPWLWALASGAAAVLLLRGATPAAWPMFLKWTAVLIATYAGFAAYNRLDKKTRIWLYSGLQLARSAAFAVLVPVTLVGAAAIGAHVFAKWVPYYIYRVGGNWPPDSHFMTRLMCYVLLSVLVGLAAGFASVWTWTAAALLAWNVFRARRDLLASFTAANRLTPREPADPHAPKHAKD
jgi:hypothetical protein